MCAAGQLDDCRKPNLGDIDRSRRQEIRRSARSRDQVAIALASTPFDFRLVARDATCRADTSHNRCAPKFQKSFRHSLALSSCNQETQKQCQRRDPCRRCVGCGPSTVQHASVSKVLSCDSCYSANHCPRVCQKLASQYQSHNNRIARSQHRRATRQEYSASLRAVSLVAATTALSRQMCDQSCL